MATNNFLRSIPPATRHLLLLNIGIWLFSFIALQFKGFDLSWFLGLHFFTSPAFNPVQLVTYMFLHDSTGFAHIFFNMFSLYMFGRVLEQVMGTKRFLFFYLSTGIGAALIQLAVIFFQIEFITSQIPKAELIQILQAIRTEGAQALQNGMNYTDSLMGELNGLINGTMIGASGAVFGILLAFGMLFPNVPLYLFFIPVPIKAKYMVIGYGLIELFFGISGAVSGVAHFAHLGGLLVGLIIILIWKKKGIVGGGYF